MSFIREAPATCGPGRRGCLFCRLLRQRCDEQNLVLLRGRLGFVVMNRYPYNNGHLMVAPNRHVADIERLRRDEWQELLSLTQQSMRALRLEMKPEGYNVGMNLGRVAGAGVAHHLHIHIVPRWLGDSNFMPLLAETKVVSEHLEESYRKLKRRFGKSPSASPELKPRPGTT
jgi:ATP adenylyltransferase